MNVKIIKDYQALIGIKDSWNNIITSDTNTDLPFYSWEWFFCSYNHYNENSSLFVVIAEVNDRIVGIMPLVKTIRTSNKIKYSELGFCNTINTPRNTIYISASEDFKLVLDSMFKYLLENYTEWEILNLVNVPDESSCHNYLTNNNSDHAQIETKGRLSPRVVMSNHKSIDEYFAEYVSKKTRKRYRVNIERLQASDMRWDSKYFTAESEMKYGLSAVFDVRKNSWKGDYESNRYPMFISELTNILSKSKEVFIAVLFFDNHPVSAVYILTKHNNYYALTNDFDMKYSEYAPGACLLYFVLKKGFEESWNFFDITGEAHDYKKSICNEFTNHSSFQLFHAGMKSRLIFHGKTKILPFLRKVINKKINDDVISVKKYR